MGLPSPAGTPEAHRCTILIDGYYQQQEAWSCPGKEGYSDFYPNGTLAATPFGAAPEQRSPMLEDRFWCNNLMSTNGVAETCNQIYLPPSPVDDFIITTSVFVLLCWFYIVFLELHILSYYYCVNDLSSSEKSMC